MEGDLTGGGESNIDPAREIRPFMRGYTEKRTARARPDRQPARGRCKTRARAPGATCFQPGPRAPETGAARAHSDAGATAGAAAGKLARCTG